MATALGIRQCKRHPCADVPVLEDFMKSNSYKTPDDKTLKILSEDAGNSMKPEQSSS